MKNIKILLVCLLAAIILSACGGVSTEVEEVKKPISDAAASQSSWLSDYVMFVEEVMESDHIPGAAVAIVEGNEVIMAEGFGWQDVENRIPVTSETLFHIGSTNKSMTSMMIATLVDDGVFNWDTPVAEIYPEFTLSSPESTQAVTIRHLLSMQSGIPDDAEDSFDIDHATAEDVLDFVADVELLGMPGAEFSYSNISASLAGYLGVLATDKEYENLYDGYASLLQEQVLDPIGMHTAFVRVSDALNSPHYGKSYTLDWTGKPVEAEPEDYDGDPLAPSGCLKASVGEMALYISTQLNQGQAPNGKQVVSAQNLAETWKPELENYAMGWEVSNYEGVEIIAHEGSFDNYLSVIGFIPDYDIGFVVLTNSEEAGEGLVTESPTYLVELLQGK